MIIFPPNICQQKFLVLDASAGLVAYEAISEAFIGGTVGVMSVMFMLEIKKKEDLSLEVNKTIF